MPFYARRITAAFTLAAAAAASNAQSVHVLSSGDELVDQAAVTLLESAGMVATIGPEYWSLSNADSMPETDAVLVLAGPNWPSADALTDAGQQVLADFADAGGGIVFSEWAGYYSTWVQSQVLADLLPTTSDLNYTALGPVTYSRTADAAPTVACLVPQTFTTEGDNFSGIESFLTAKPDATVFYQSAATGLAGLTGWEYGEGRVAHFSAVLGPILLGDATFGRLILNTILWSTGEGGGTQPACPADLVRDGLLDLADITAFVTAFSAGCE